MEHYCAAAIQSQVERSMTLVKAGLNPTMINNWTPGYFFMLFEAMNECEDAVNSTDKTSPKGYLVVNLPLDKQLAALCQAGLIFYRPYQGNQGDCAVWLICSAISPIG